MKLGTDEPKKVIFLGALVLIVGYFMYSNLASTPGSSGGPPPARVAQPIPAGARPVASPAPRAVQRASGTRLQSDEFHPVMHPKRPEDRVDPRTVDPTLRLDLLAKLQKVDSSGPGRNLFQFAPPPVKAVVLKDPEPKVIPKPIVAAEPPKPVAPPPQPIPLRYYGSSSATGNNGRTAFFLDGDEIVFGKEGDTVKRRYRVVRIGVNSVVMEDIESKRQQTLPMEELAG